MDLKSPQKKRSSYLMLPIKKSAKIAQKYEIESIPDNPLEDSSKRSSSVFSTPVKKGKLTSISDVEPTYQRKMEKRNSVTVIETPNTFDDLNKKATLKEETTKSHLHKKGHRKVGRDGTIFYKKTPTSQLIQSIQLGIASLIGHSHRNEEHDLLMKDFSVVKTIMFPRTGSSVTPPHAFADFRFRAFAPVAFYFFRVVFYITTDSFMASICGETLKELSNPGASGSIFYKTPDDCFILKTVQHREADFLRSLLPGYYMNVSQNNHTMLPKFYGLYSYENLGRSIRLVVMNNALPSNIPIQEKYDLKGSTYKRVASKKERKKVSPTLKDLDFIAAHKDGFFMTPQHRENFLNTLSRDTKVLESFKIMDYSLLLGVHYRGTTLDGIDGPSEEPSILPDLPIAKSGFELARSGMVTLGMSRKESSGSLHGVPARTADGKEVVLYAAVIDILQRYRISKKMEHAFKSIIADGDMISVSSPKFYRKRFLNFMSKYFVSSEDCSCVGKSVSITYGSEINKLSYGFNKMKHFKISSDYPTSDSSLVNNDKFISMDSVGFYDTVTFQETDL